MSRQHTSYITLAITPAELALIGQIIEAAIAAERDPAAIQTIIARHHRRAARCRDRIARAIAMDQRDRKELNHA